MLGEWTLAARLGRTAENLGAGPEASVTRIAAAVHLNGWGEAAAVPDEPDEALSDELMAQQIRLRAGHLTWSEGHLTAGREALVDAATQLGAPARARLLVDAAYIAIAMCEPMEAERLALQAMNDAREQPRLQAMGITSLAWVLQGRANAARQLSEIAMPPETSALPWDPYPNNSTTMMAVAHCLALVCDGLIDDAATSARAVLEESQREDLDEVSEAIEMSLVGRMALLQGQLPLARRYGEEALLDSEPGPMSLWPAAVAAASAAQLGAVAAAEAALGRVADVHPTISILAYELELARAWLVAAQGDLRRAHMMATLVANKASATGTHLVEMFALLDLTRLGGAETAAPRLIELNKHIDGAFAVAVAEYATAAAGNNGARSTPCPSGSRRWAPCCSPRRRRLVRHPATGPRSGAGRPADLALAVRRSSPDAGVLGRPRCSTSTPCPCSTDSLDGNSTWRSSLHAG